MVCPITQGDHN